MLILKFDNLNIMTNYYKFIYLKFYIFTNNSQLKSKHLAGFT